MAVLGVLGMTMAMSVRAEAPPWSGCFDAASRLHGVDVALLHGVAATESNWNADARSHANAHGVMQIQWPGTARHLGVRRVSELYNPCLNIELGARYLRELLDRWDGDEVRALAAYNYGPTRIAAVDVLPDGAAAYANRVLAHRDRIRSAAEPAVASLRVASTAATMQFASRVRAERYAAALAAQVSSVRFEVEAHDRLHRVRLVPIGEEISATDARRLAALGWGIAG